MEIDISDRARWQEQKAQVRARYGSLFMAVSDTLYLVDPVRINYGVNPDEYDSEAITILMRLPEARTEEDALVLIHEEFIRWFGPNIAGPRERYRESAVEIWKLWQEMGD